MTCTVLSSESRSLLLASVAVALTCCGGATTAPASDDGGAPESADAGDDAGVRTRVVEVCGAGNYSCALRNDRAVYCWGFNEAGVLGLPSSTTSVSSAPLRIGGLPADVTDIYCGGRAPCARSEGGRVWCWGANEEGEVGNGSAGGEVDQPASVVNLGDALEVATGESSACARRANGSIACWGDNRAGELGIGTADYEPHPTPQPVSGLTATMRVSSAGGVSCALLPDATARCWGIDDQGQLGDQGSGLNNLHATPIVLAGVSGIARLSMGATSGCALLKDGTATCWGDNTAGQLGRGATGGNSLPAAPVVGLSSAIEVSASGVACAVRSDGRLLCWGDNEAGQVGLGTVGGTVSAPALVPSLTNVSHVAVGRDHACAITADGVLWCWGANDQGQLGIGTTSANVPTPTQVVW